MVQTDSKATPKIGAYMHVGTVPKYFKVLPEDFKATYIVSLESRKVLHPYEF